MHPEALRTKVRQHEADREINVFLRGFAEYFRYGNSSIKLAQINRYAAERLALFVGKRHKRGRRDGWRHLVDSPSPHGADQSQRNHRRPQTTGLAEQAVMPSVKNVGEPCAGEPHARFDAAAGGNQHQSGQHGPRGARRLPPTLPRRRPNEVSRYIDEHHGRFGVEPICRTLGASASPSYQRASGQRSERPRQVHRGMTVAASKRPAAMSDCRSRSSAVEWGSATGRRRRRGRGLSGGWRGGRRAA